MESYQVSRNTSPPPPRLRIIRLPATKPYKRPRARPPPAVHHVDCSGFRQLVQRLTGALRPPPLAYAPRAVRGLVRLRLPLIDDAAAAALGGGGVPFADVVEEPSDWSTPWNATNSAAAAAAAAGAPSTETAAWSAGGGVPFADVVEEPSDWSTPWNSTNSAAAAAAAAGAP